MTVVWEEPEAPPGPGRGRAKSELRKEADEMMDALRENPGRWARLWDLEDQSAARKRQGFVQKKGYSFAVRETEHGWSVFGRFKGDNPAAAEVRGPTFG